MNPFRRLKLVRSAPSGTPLRVDRRRHNPESGDPIAVAVVPPASGTCAGLWVSVNGVIAPRSAS